MKLMRQEMKKFVYKFFQDNGLVVQDFNLHHLNENSVHLYVSYYLNLKSTFLLTRINSKQNIKLVKEDLKKLKPLWKEKKYEEILKKLKQLLMKSLSGLPILKENQ